MFLSRQLIQFFAIAENSSLAEAAKKLNLTSSALSHGIHDFECKIGISLIKRTGQKSSLTIAGKNLYEQLLPSYILMTDISDNLSGKKKNNNFINIKTDSLCHSPLKDKIITFCKEKPELTLSMEPTEDIDIKHEIANNNTDIVISSDYIEDNKIINHLDLPPEKVGIVAHNSLLKKYNSISDLITHERIIKTKTKSHKNILNKLLHILKIDKSDCNLIKFPAESDTREFIFSAVGFSLISENKTIIDNIKNKDCSFINLPSEYNISINRRIYFRENHNQTISDFILKIRSN